jgi:hypothetical protein
VCTRHERALDFTIAQLLNRLCRPQLHPSSGIYAWLRWAETSIRSPAADETAPTWDRSTFRPPPKSDRLFTTR